MAILLLLVLVAGVLLLAAAFLAVMMGPPRRAKWVGLATIAASAPFFFWLGTFAERFGAGQCYSSAMGLVANAVEATDSPEDLAKRLRALPMRGYETYCPEVEAAARQLPSAGSP